MEVLKVKMAKERSSRNSVTEVLPSRTCAFNARSDGLTVLKKKNNGAENENGGGTAAKSRRRTAGDANSVASHMVIKYQKLKKGKSI